MEEQLFCESELVLCQQDFHVRRNIREFSQSPCQYKLIKSQWLFLADAYPFCEDPYLSETDVIAAGIYKYIYLHEAARFVKIRSFSEFRVPCVRFPILFSSFHERTSRLAQNHSNSI